MLAIASLNQAIHRHWSLAWPLILANCAIPLLGLADAAIAGHLNAVFYLAAVTVGAELFAIFFGTFSFLRMGTTGLVAQAIGRADSDRGLSILWHALFMATVIGVCLSAFGSFWVKPVINWAQPATEITAPLIEYIEIRLYSAPASLCLYALTGWFIGAGQTRVALYLALGINVTNIALNYLLAIGLEMNSAGIAWGTVAAEYLGLGYGLIWLFAVTDRSELWQHRKPRLHIVSALARVNLPLMLRTLALQTVFVGLSISAARMGAIEASAVGIFLVLLATAAYALDGFAYASEIEAGQALGEKNGHRFKKSLWGGVILTLTSALAFAAAIKIAGPSIIGLLTLHSAAVEAAVARLHDFQWILLTLCFAYWLDGVFIGLTRTYEMCIAMCLATVIGWFGGRWLYSNASLDQLFDAFWLFCILRTIFLAIRLPNAIHTLSENVSARRPLKSEPV